MLRKFASIKNTGRFVNSGAIGDVELKRYNLIFGENGRGKTTLCAILRSLQSGDPVHITGRRTLGGFEDPEVNILMQTGHNAVYGNVGWSRTVPEIAVFDATFVSENVHSGDVVDIDHRRSLYTVIVGEQGVKLARQIDELDEKARNEATHFRSRATDHWFLVKLDTLLTSHHVEPQELRREIIKDVMASAFNETWETDTIKSAIYRSHKRDQHQESE